MPRGSFIRMSKDDQISDLIKDLADHKETHLKLVNWLKERYPEVYKEYEDEFLAKLLGFLD